MVYATSGPNGPRIRSPGPPDMTKAPGSRDPRAFIAGPEGPVGLPARTSRLGYALVFSASIASISSSDSRPGVGMLNFVIAKRNTT